jgi:preprotein translocase, YajC subunit
MDGMLSPEAMQSLMNYAPFILMGIVFYFVLYRPQKRQEKARNEMLASIKRGDRVITVGGIHGMITKLSDDGIVVLEVADKVELTFNRSAINAVIPK